MNSSGSHRLKRSVLCMALVAGLPLVAAEPAAALPPRSLRAAERIYARQAIAAARAARAEARAAEVAKVVPEPPPPRPATLRRMARAGVPLGPPPQTVIVAQEKPPAPRAPAAVVQTPPSRLPKATQAPPPAVTAARPKVADPGRGAWTLDPDPASSPVVDGDGTRSVLATGGEGPPPAAPSSEGDRPGPAVTQPPIELLPTPPAQ